MLLRVSPRLIVWVVNSGSVLRWSSFGFRYSVKVTLKVARTGVPSFLKSVNVCVKSVITPSKGKSEPLGAVPQLTRQAGGCLKVLSMRVSATISLVFSLTSFPLPGSVTSKKSSLMVSIRLLPPPKVNLGALSNSCVFPSPVVLSGVW